MRIHFIETPAATLTELRKAYCKTQTAPLDGMWLTFAEMGTFNHIEIDGRSAGYTCCNDQGEMLQFYLIPHFVAVAETVFNRFLEGNAIKAAQVPTTDPLFLSLAIDKAAKANYHTMLYQYQDARAHHLDPKVDLTMATQDDFTDCLAFLSKSLDDQSDWLKTYCQGLIERGELYMLLEKGAIVATGELRPSPLQPEYADLGYVVQKNLRGLGIGTKVFVALIALTRHRGLTPICSTERTNLAARRSIEKAGFLSNHRIFLAQWNES